MPINKTFYPSNPSTPLESQNRRGFRNMTPEQKLKWRNALYLIGGALKGNDMSQDWANLQQMEAMNRKKQVMDRYRTNPNTPLSQVDLIELLGPEEFFKAKMSGGKDGTSLIANAQYLNKLRTALRLEPDPNKKAIIQQQINDVVGLGSVGKYNPELRGAVAEAVEKAKTGTESVLSPGQKSMDQAFASRYIAWEGGERQQTDQNIKNLSAKLDILISGDKNVSGPILGQIPEGIRAITNPDSLAFIGDIRDVVFQSLRATLGAQFTEKEGERLVAAAFDARLSEEENYKRLKRLVEKIQNTRNSMDSMSDYWSKHGTLQGYESSPIVFQDVFDSFVEEDFTGKSDEELKSLYYEGDITLQNSIINFLEEREKNDSVR